MTVNFNLHSVKPLSLSLRIFEGIALCLKLLLNAIEARFKLGVRFSKNVFGICELVYSWQFRNKGGSNAYF